ncbi:2609_t:CDS:1, partial [Racocetra fulgida]
LCFKCGQKGHIAKTCPNNANTNPEPLSSSNTNVEQVSSIELESE